MSAVAGTLPGGRLAARGARVGTGEEYSPLLRGLTSATLRTVPVLLRVKFGLACTDVTPAPVTVSAYGCSAMSPTRSEASYISSISSVDSRFSKPLYVDEFWVLDLDRGSTPPGHCCACFQLLLLLEEHLLTRRSHLPLTARTILSPKRPAGG